MQIPATKLFNPGESVYLNVQCKDFNIPLCGSHEKASVNSTYVFSPACITVDEPVPLDTLSYGFVFNESNCNYNRDLVHFNNILYAEAVACTNCTDDKCKIGDNCQSSIATSSSFVSNQTNTSCDFTGTDGTFYQNNIITVAGTFTLKDFLPNAKETVYISQIGFRIPNQGDLPFADYGLVYGRFFYIAQKNTPNFVFNKNLTFVDGTTTPVNELQKFLMVKKSPGYLFATVDNTGIQILKDDSSTYFQGPTIYTDPYLNYNLDFSLIPYYYHSVTTFTYILPASLPSISGLSYGVEINQVLKTIGVPLDYIVLYVT
jgi:hypothetical protein